MVTLALSRPIYKKEMRHIRASLQVPRGTANIRFHTKVTFEGVKASQVSVSGKYQGALQDILGQRKIGFTLV